MLSVSLPLAAIESRERERETLNSHMVFSQKKRRIKEDSNSSFQWLVVIWEDDNDVVARLHEHMDCSACERTSRWSMIRSPMSSLKNIYIGFKEDQQTWKVSEVVSDEQWKPSRQDLVLEFAVSLTSSSYVHRLIQHIPMRLVWSKKEQNSQYHV